MSNSLKNTRRLVIALIISGALNVCLLAFIFYLSHQENLLNSYCSQSPTIGQTAQHIPLVAAHRSNSEVICNLRSLSLAQLKANLSNTELVEEGYTQRDLALAVLVAFHYFDLDRALIGYTPVQQRRLAYGKYQDGRVAELTVYPGLSEKQYASLLDFATTERWPISSKGLFLAMTANKGAGLKENPSLADAFYMTKEFVTAEALFGVSQMSVERRELLDMLLQGEWNMLANLFSTSNILQEQTIAKQQNILIQYIDQGSKAAAHLLLKNDKDFALRRLDDTQVIHLLKLLDEKTGESENFALTLLKSPRTDAVWRAAVECLYRYAGESIPQNGTCHSALAHFVPQNGKEVVEATPQPTSVSIPQSPTLTVVAKSVSKGPSVSMISGNKNKDSLYVVQEGDSLWKISRRFNVDVACLKSHNRLDSDLLRPGKSLRIPK